MRRLLLITICYLLLPNIVSGQQTQKYKWKSVNIGGGGFTTGFCYSPAEKDLLYLRTDVGGAYRWNETAKEWEPMTDWITAEEWTFLGIEGFCVDPTAANRLYMMGGLYTNRPSSILKSEDYGHTFKRIDVPFQINGNGSGRSNGERMCVDPNNPAVVYCASRRQGIWRSVDYGETWSQIESFINDTKLNVAGETWNVSFIVVDPESGVKGMTSETIVAGLSRKDAYNVYRSDDAGKTWKPVTGFNTAYMPAKAVLASDGHLFIGFNSELAPTWGNGALYKYHIVLNRTQNISPDGANKSAVAVDWQNPNHIVVSTISSFSFWKATGMYGDRIHRSIDGGITWKELTNNASVRLVLDHGEYTWAKSVNPHWLGDIKIDPHNSNRMFFTSGNGVFRCDNLLDLDKGEPVTFYFSTNGINETVPLGLVSPTAGAALLHTIGDYCGFRHEDLDKPGIVFNRAGGSNSTIDAAHNAPDMVLRVTGSKDEPIVYSTDNGKNWLNGSTYKSADAIQGGKCAISCDGETFVWSPTNVPMRVSQDKGVTWTIPTGNVPNNLLPVADKINPNKLYFLDNNRLYRSTDKGKSFRSYSTQNLADAPPISGLQHMQASYEKEGALYVPYNSNGLYRIEWDENDRPSFKKITTVTQCACVGFGKAAPGRTYPTLFILGRVVSWGTKTGIFRSDDNGVSWVRVNDDMNQFGSAGNANRISGDPKKFGRVYMSTIGRGVVYGEIDESGNIESTQEKQIPCKIFMNDDTGKFCIETEGDFLCSVYSMSGMKLMEQKGQNQLSLGDTLLGGNYIVQVSTGHWVTQTKVLKK